MNQYRYLPNLQFGSILDQSNSEDIKKIIDQLNIPKSEIPSRKADRIKLLVNMLSRERLQQEWKQLNQNAKHAVSETLYGTGGYMDHEKFKAKYGKDAYNSLFEESRYSEFMIQKPLKLFLYPPYRNAHRSYVIPLELQSRLRTFVPEPIDQPIQTQSDLPDTFEFLVESGWGKSKKYEKTQKELTRRDTEHDALLELKSVMQLASLGKLGVSPKTRKPTAASVKQIGNILSGGDFYDESGQTFRSYEQQIGPIRAYAWLWLLQAAKLIQQRGNKVELTKAGHSALNKSASDVIRSVWRSWVKNSILDEFNRIDDIKGQTGKAKRSMTNPAGRRRVIEAALKLCPIGEWVEFEEFSRYMRATDHIFEVTRDAWSLYITDANYGSLGYNEVWEIIEARYILCLLFEYAATLGLVDVAYMHPRDFRDGELSNLWGTDELYFLSRYDGLVYFRLNNLGAFCLGLRNDYEPKEREIKGSLSVMPNRTVQLSDDFPQDGKIFMQAFASFQSENLCQLELDRILTALESGRTISELQGFLEARDEQMLPERIIGFFRQVERQSKAIRLQGTALVFECVDEEFASKLIADKQVGKYCEFAGKNRFTVKVEFEERFRKALRKIGYIISND